MDFIELLAAMLQGILKLVFGAYIILLIIMLGTGIIGVVPITYFVSEICMLIVGYIVYKVRREAYGGCGFPVIWANCSLVGFWPLLTFGVSGLIFTVIARFFFLVVCYRK